VKRGTRYVVARRRGRTTAYFYGASLKQLRSRLRDGEEFRFAKLELGPECLGRYAGAKLTMEVV
jgi:hypothetical protein